jgi:hypothetical protein
LTRLTAFRPAAPSGAAAHRTAANQVKVVWGDNSNTEQGFRIERSLDGVSFTEIATVGSNILSMVDANLNAATSYYYRVRAYNATGTSGYSMVGSATTPFPQLRMAAAGENVVVTWPQWGNGFRLQVADRLTSPQGWTDVQATMVTNTSGINVTLPRTSGPRFYRLWRP